MLSQWKAGERHTRLEGHRKAGVIELGPESTGMGIWEPGVALLVYVLL